MLGYFCCYMLSYNIGHTFLRDWCFVVSTWVSWTFYGCNLLFNSKVSFVSFIIIVILFNYIYYCNLSSALLSRFYSNSVNALSYRWAPTITLVQLMQVLCVDLSNFVDLGVYIDIVGYRSVSFSCSEVTMGQSLRLRSLVRWHNGKVDLSFILNSEASAF